MVLMENDIIKKIELLKKYQSETNQIEAKTASKDFPKKCYDTISSFSNTYGGTIIFGIDEENGFTEHDVYDIKDLQSKISSLCADAMEPIIRPEFEMKKNKLPEPIFEEIRGDFKVTFKNDSMDIDQGIDQGVDQGKNKMNINKNILEFCKIPRTAKEIAINFGYSSHKYFKRKYIKPLLLSGNLKMTIPEKPSSENQK